MGKNLVIVESPAKAKTIEGYLGKGYSVKSSFGHVRDLPHVSSRTVHQKDLSLRVVVALAEKHDRAGRWSDAGKLESDLGRLPECHRHRLRIRSGHRAVRADV